MKTEFQKGDRVFDIARGFGTVLILERAEFPIAVIFDEGGKWGNYTSSHALRPTENRSLWPADLVELKEYVAGLKGE